MKKTILIIIITVMLSACSNINDISSGKNKKNQEILQENIDKTTNNNIKRIGLKQIPTEKMKKDLFNYLLKDKASIILLTLDESKIHFQDVLELTEEILIECAIRYFYTSPIEENIYNYNNINLEEGVPEELVRRFISDVFGRNISRRQENQNINDNIVYDFTKQTYQIAAYDMHFRYYSYLTEYCYIQDNEIEIKFDLYTLHEMYTHEEYPEEKHPNMSDFDLIDQGIISKKIMPKKISMKFNTMQNETGEKYLRYISYEDVSS